MKNLILALFGCGALLLTAVVLAQPVTQSPLVQMPPGLAAARSGACMFPAGGWATVNPDTVTHAVSSQLNAWSRYVIQCTTDTYIAPGTSAATADSGDGYLPSGAWLEFMTTDSVRYVSVLSVSSDGTCKLVECL